MAGAGVGLPGYVVDSLWLKAARVEKANLTATN